MIVVALILIIMPISGCSESSQLHQKLIVQGIGIDVNDDNYKVTMQAYDYQNPTSENEPTLKVVELTGKSIMEAFSSIYKQTGLEPLYSQNMLIVLGEDVAKNGVSRVMDFFIRHYEVRPDVKICVARGNAYDIIKSETNEGYVKVKDISELVYDKCDVVHFVGMIRDGVSSPSVTALKLQNANNDKESKDGENKIVSDGIAYFREDKLVDFSDESQTKGIELINGNCVGKTYVVDMGNNIKASCTVTGVSKEVKPVITDTNVDFNINIKVDAGVFEVAGRNMKLGTSISKYELERNLALHINDLSKQAVDKVVVKNGTDIFRFGKILMNTNPNYFRSLESWSDTLKKTNYNINTEVKISISGTEIIF